MALVKCSECENEISDTASVCPECGASVTRNWVGTKISARIA